MIEFRKKSVIDRVEPTQDSLGWIVFFDRNKYQQRIPAKYSVEPRVGDSIELFGFPYTHGVKINHKIVFMLNKKAINVHYNDLYVNQKKVQNLEKLLVKTRIKVEV